MFRCLLHSNINVYKIHVGLWCNGLGVGFRVYIFLRPWVRFQQQAEFFKGYFSLSVLLTIEYVEMYATISECMLWVSSVTDIHVIASRA